MPIALQNQLVPVNTTTTFNFDNDIWAYVVGIGGFDFYFPDDADNQIHQISLNLSSNQIGRSVSVYVDAVMQDTDGHNLEPGRSVATVAIVAWLGANPNDVITLASAPSSISNGQSSPPFQVAPQGALDINEAFLSGFSVVYDGVHNVETVMANAGSNLEPGGESASITSTVKMFDTSGNSAVNASIDGGYIASINAGLVAKLATYDGQVVNFGATVSTAVALLVGFSVSYGDEDHWVKEICVGNFSAPLTLDGGNATVGMSSYMKDASGDIATGHVTMVILGATH